MNAKNELPQDEKRTPGNNQQPEDLWQIWDTPDNTQCEQRPQLYLLVAPRRALRGMIAAAAARLCLNGAVRVLDGGDLYDARSVARMTRLLTPRLDEALGRIEIAQAFTCYQVETLLAAQQAGPDPWLGLDLLDTFADENAPLAHRDYLAQLLVQHLLRLARQSITLVGVAPAENPPVNSYVAWLTRAAERVLRLEAPQSSRPLWLF
jgi:hypothetical protein